MSLTMTTAETTRAVRLPRRSSAVLFAVIVALGAAFLGVPVATAAAAPAAASVAPKPAVSAPLKLARLQVKKIRSSLAGTTPTLATARLKAHFDASLLVKINRARAQHGVAPIKLVRSLVTVADHWTGEMVSGATKYTLAHNARLDRMTHAVRPKTTAWGENVAQFTEGSHTATQIFALYMGSPGHRANILSPKFRVIGLSTACVAAGKHAGTCFNTMDFAR